MQNAKIAIAKALVVATALAGFMPSVVKAQSNIANDTVSFTASVAESLTFTIDDKVLEFGVLSTSASWADLENGNATEVSGNTFDVSTNSQNGVSIALTGSTLTHSNDSDTIEAIGGTGIDITSGTYANDEKFGISFDNAGTTLSVNAEYRNGSDKYAFQANDAVITSSGPIDDTVDVYYAAKIAPLTDAGVYDTTLTFSATTTF